MRLGSTTMIAGAMASAIGFYTLSLHVSAERAKAERLEAHIASDLKDIRALEAELRTRARLPVLQKWNDEVLAMSAPTAKQFAEPVQLAAFAPNAPAAAAAPAAPEVQFAIATPESAPLPKPGIVKASYEVPTAPAVYTAAVRTAPVEAVEAAPKRNPAPTARPAQAERPKVEAKVVKADVKVVKAEAKPAAPVKVAEAKPRTAPKSLAGLDSLANVIDSAAAAEKGGFRKVSMQ